MSRIMEHIVDHTIAFKLICFKSMKLFFFKRKRETLRPQKDFNIKKMALDIMNHFVKESGVQLGKTTSIEVFWN